jgi:glycosyltransferase involved in cell wall biosynthesis
MQGQPQAEKWVRDEQLYDHVLLLPYLPQEQLWQLYIRCQVYISLSSHDGTPNTFLEALACGCFPIVGNIESLQEWIKDEENGFLVNPRDPHQVAEAIIRALKNSELRSKAARNNRRLISEHANFALVQKEYQIFLDYLLAGKH